MKLEFLNLQLNRISMKQLLQEIVEKAKKKESAYLCAVNVHMTVEAQTDQELLKSITKATWAVTDGTPVAWAFSRLHKIRQERVAGMDITPQLLHLAESNHLIVSVYGNTKEVLKDFENYLREHFPNIRIGACISPPFRELSVNEQKSYIDKLASVGTNILFVSLGCPKQEKWMYRHSQGINAVSLGIGNAINTTIGKEKRPPKFIQKIGMEWLMRLFQDPKRLFKRYLITNTKFCLLLLKLLLNR